MHSSVRLEHPRSDATCSAIAAFAHYYLLLTIDPARSRLPMRWTVLTMVEGVGPFVSFYAERQTTKSVRERAEGGLRTGSLKLEQSLLSGPIREGDEHAVAGARLLGGLPVVDELIRRGVVPK
jgi:hypothetical protein